jgi:hypothetical protein
MHNRQLLLVCLMAMVVGTGCAKDLIVEVPAGHVGLVCSNDDRPESCGLWMHDPGTLVIREDEKLRLIDCAPFVRKHSATKRTRDNVLVEIGSDVSYGVSCKGFEIKQAFRLASGDVGSDVLFIAYGLPGLNDSLELASTSLLSHEIAKDPERLMDLASAVVRRPDSVSGPLTMKRFIVTSINLQEGNGDWRNIYNITGK